MSPSAPPGNAPALPADLLGGLIGAESKAEFEFTAQILEALGKISPDLVPRIDGHPLADAIRRGVSAYSDLLTDYRNIKDEYARGAVLDDRPARWLRLGLLRRLAKRE